MSIKDQLDLLIGIGFLLTSVVIVLSILMYSRKHIGKQVDRVPEVSVRYLPANGPGGHNYYLIGRNGAVLDSWVGPDKE